MTDALIVIAALTVATVALKAVGPVSVGAREPSERVLAVTSLLAPALLAGLVVYETFGTTSGPGVTVDARLGGLAAAVLALVLRLPMLAVVAVAAAATAVLRLLGL
jgi:branched-subunit amino acid transport protein AzlD